MPHSRAHDLAQGRGGGAGSALAPETLASRRAVNRRRMVIAAAINAGLVAVGVVGGILTGSLALLADAGHVLTDLGSIGLALLAVTLASRSAGSRRTFGYQRSEVIVALVNGLALLAVAALIVVAAIDRLSDPPDVEGGGVIALGLVALAGNGAATWVLAGGHREDLNLEALLRHTAADAIGALGVVVSGAVVLASGWEPIDPAIAILIAILIAASSVRLVRDPLDVLMEAAPPGLDVDEIARGVCAVAGVRSVHELHVWSVTPGFDALAAHVVVASGQDRDRARREVEYLLTDRYGIDHTTLQMEEEADEDTLLQVQTKDRRDRDGFS